MTALCARHVMRVALRLLIVVAAYGTTSGNVLRAQQPDAPSDKATQLPSATFRTSADYVEVDVVVTDKRGEFVRNLRKEDFRVSESGHPQDVATLQQVDLTSATTRPTDRAPGFASGTDQTPVGSEVGRMYFLVLDDLHTSPEVSGRVRAIAKRLIERCTVGTDRAALVFTSGRRDAARQLTNNSSQLVDAINSFVGQKPPSETVERYGNMTAIPAPAADDLRRRQALLALDTIAQVVDYAASFQSRRKSIVLVSEGTDVDLDGKGDGPRDLRNKIRDLTAVANRASVSIYAIDPRGATQGGEHAAEITGSGASQTKLQDEVRVSQAGLTTIAEGTGGSLFQNAAQFDRIFSLIEAANSAYYVLTYRSSTQSDGKFHSIDVRVLSTGLTVRARKGFVKSPVAFARPFWSGPPDSTPTSRQPEVTPQRETLAPGTPVPVIPPTPTAGSPTPMPGSPVPAVASPETETAVTGPVNLNVVLERARRYIEDYESKLALTIGVERYAQWVDNSDQARMMVESGGQGLTRNTVSEFALVRVNDEWVGYRDVYEADGREVRDRRDRLQELFEHNPATAIDLARRIADESARYNAGLQRNINVPTMALSFLRRSNAGRFRFKQDGTDTIQGMVAWKVRYEETSTPTIIRTSGGRDIPVKGWFLIEPSQGRVLRTFLEITSEARLDGGTSLEDSPKVPDSRKVPVTAPPRETYDHRVQTYSRITVAYKFDAHLEMLLPAEMAEEYQGITVNPTNRTQRLTKMTGRATYSDFKKFETSGRIVVPK
jgi:VWFA-related protein